MYLEEIIELINNSSKVGITYIRTGTNGFLLKGADKSDFTDKVARLAQTLSETKLYTFWISVDSAIASVHEKMRGLSGVIDGIKKALPIFHKSGLYPAANLGINRSVAVHREVDVSKPEEFYNAYREGFRRFYRHVIDLGFTIVNACYPMSIDSHQENSSLSAVYAASSEDRVVNFTLEEKVLIFKALFDTIPEFRSQIRIFSPRVSLYSLIEQHRGNSELTYACRGGIDFFFVDAKGGDTYPCGYRGIDNFGKFWNLDIKNISEKKQCRDCDWECFRDPSVLFGPFLTFSKHPLSFIRRMFTEKQFTRLWYEDLLYYSACDFFNGRKALNMKKLSAFR